MDNLEKYLLTDVELAEVNYDWYSDAQWKERKRLLKAQLEKASPLIAGEIKEDFEKTFEFVDGKLRFKLTPEDSVLKSTQVRVNEFWERWQRPDGH